MRNHENQIAKGAVALGLSSGVAYAISALALPLVALLYSPCDFGVSAQVLALISILAAIAGLRLDTAISLPRCDREAFRLAIASTFVAAMTCLLAAGCLLVASFARWMPDGLRPQSLAWLIPPGAFIVAVSAVAGQILSRHGQVAAIAKAKVASAVATAGLQVGFGASSLGAAGLAFGDLLGRTAGLWRATANVARLGGASRGELSVGACLRSAWAYRTHSAWLAPASIVDALSLELPILLVVAWSSEADAGRFALAQRAVALPVGLAGQSVARIYMPALARTIHEGPEATTRIVGSTAKLTAKLAAPVLMGTLLVALLPEEVIASVRWSSWAGVTQYLVPLGVLAAFQIVGGPLSHTLVVLGDQRGFALWTVFRLALVVCGMAVGNARASAQGTAWGLAIAGVLSYVVLLVLIRRRLALAAIRSGPSATQPAARRRVGAEQGG